LLLRHWFGTAARDPGDADWIVLPATQTINDRETTELFNYLRGLARPLTHLTGVTIADVQSDDIWTYDRVPGRRIVYYWRRDAIGAGCLQMDFVFGEELWTDPIRTRFAAGLTKPITILTASMELSLAWKLIWLESDMYPQGKDLYDAVLLAENTAISPRLLRRVVANRMSPFAPISATRESLPSDVDWASFKSEYPSIPEHAAYWHRRLIEALQDDLEALKREG
jgi:hypothetical protein